MAIGDGDDQDWLAEAAVASILQDQWAQDLVLQLAAHGRQTGESSAADHLSHLLLAADVVALVGGIHEAHLNAVVVEERSGICNTSQDQLEIVNSFTILLKLHAATVVDVKNHIVQG